jgi:hypothetical protein
MLRASTEAIAMLAMARGDYKNWTIVSSINAFKP